MNLQERMADRTPGERAVRSYTPASKPFPAPPPPPPAPVRPRRGNPKALLGSLAVLGGLLAGYSLLHSDTSNKAGSTSAASSAAAPQSLAGADELCIGYGRFGQVVNGVRNQTMTTQEEADMLHSAANALLVSSSQVTSATDKATVQDAYTQTTKLRVAILNSNSTGIAASLPALTSDFEQLAPLRTSGGCA